MEMEINESQRWEDLDKVLTRPSKFAQDTFEPSQEFKQIYFDYAEVLVIGAGGLGCEILKNLALSGVKKIHVIDLDIIELTNLNRQFLFRKTDVDKYKSEVAANFIMNRVPGCQVTYSTKKIQDLELSFWENYYVIIAGLDNVEARRYLNQIVHSLVQFDDDKKPIPSTQKYLIDGGTEMFNGQARVIKPFETACYECTLGSITKQERFNFCTISNTPRIPQHCIAFIYLIEWEKQFPNKKIDTDSFEDINWIYQRALDRAAQYNIQGVTYDLTLGVVKNIIPAVASTNAIIAAACTNEFLKIFSGCSKVMDNYFFYFGNTNINTNTYRYERDENCLICSNKPSVINCSLETELNELVDILKQKPFDLKDPSLQVQDGRYLIPPVNRAAYAQLLPKTFQQLIEENEYTNGQIIYVFDTKLVGNIKINLKFQ